MGFIQSGSTLTLTAYLTQKGRDLLLNGSESDITGKYFSVGDSDTNYNVEIRNPEGFVPDLTGDNSDCILSLADNVGIKYNILYSDAQGQDIVKSQVRLMRTDNSKYYSVIDCLVNLDSIGRYMLYHSSDNLNNPNGAKVNNQLSPIFNTLFSQVDLLNNPSDSPLETDIDPVSDFDFELAFDPTIYTSIINTYLNGDVTVNQSGNIVSPLMLTFSSRNGSKGAGSASFGIFGREIGYVYKPIYDNTNQPNIKYLFYNPSLIENQLQYTFYTDENNQLLDKYTDFTLATTINSKNLNSGILETTIFRGDTNLANISSSNISTFSNEIKNANQHLKLFKRDGSNVIINGGLVTNGSIGDDGMGITQKEILNLKDFIEISPYFTKTLGTNEYRTSKLTFNVYPKGNRNVVPATLNIVLKFNQDILLNGDSVYNKISDEGDKNFIQYDFTSTNGVFQNVAKTGSFIRNNCTSGSNGSAVTYVVPKGTYTGTTQAQADNLAQNDITTNGQGYANTNGTCTLANIFTSAAYSANIQKSDCPANMYGSTVHVEVPQGQFTSTISQFDANVQATTFATQQANSLGTCLTYTAPIQNTGGGGCLLTGERIIINEGFDSVAVEDLQVGDMIYTAHENTKELGYYKILHNNIQTIDQWVYVITEDGRTISCSPTHLFMVNFKKTLVTTMKKGDCLSALTGDEQFEKVIIKDIIYANNRVNVHKLEVDKAHTYISDNLIWHHNKFQAVDANNGENTVIN